MAEEDDLRNSLESLKAATRTQAVQDRLVDVQEDNTAKLQGAINDLRRLVVLVGIPADEAARSGSDARISNAVLGYIQETGSPINNIPARPFLQPGVKNSAAEWQPKLAQAAQAALQYDQAGVMTALGQAGTIAVRAVKRTVQAGITPPLQESTEARRRRRTPGSKYRRKAQTSADVTPLIDTGQLVNSVTYVVVKE